MLAAKLFQLRVSLPWKRDKKTRRRGSVRVRVARLGGVKLAPSRNFQKRLSDGGIKEAFPEEEPIERHGTIWLISGMCKDLGEGSHDVILFL